MKILEEDQIPQKKEEGEIRKYYFFPDFDNFEFVITHIPPNKVEETHGHKIINEAIYVISGEVVAIENGSEKILKTNDAVLFEVGKLHTISNVSNDDSILLTIKQPKALDKFFGDNYKKQNLTNNELLVILEQNWLHARHVEDERLWFTNIYALIVAISIIGLRLFWPLIFASLFLIFLSLLGIIATYKLTAEFHNHIEKIELIIEKLNAKKYMGLPLDLYPGGKWKFIRFTIAMYLLYILVTIVTCSGLVYLLMYPCKFF